MKHKNTKIIIAKPTGFCFGVKRAIAIVKREAKAAQGKYEVVTLGPIIHNNQVLNELKKLNVKIVSSGQELSRTKGTSPIIIIRSHGCAPQVIKRIESLGYKIIDATCPYVKRVQNYAAELKKQSYFTVVIGDKNHPEVKGIVGYAGDRSLVYDINSIIKNKNLKLNQKRVGVVAQTTISLLEFRQAVNSLVGESFSELRIFNTLCRESQNRQNTCQTVANHVNLMIVVGSRNSANTLSLAQIAKKSCQKVYQVENKNELNEQWFKEACRKPKSVIRIGVIAGASTPQHTVFEVSKELSSLCIKNSNRRS